MLCFCQYVAFLQIFGYLDFQLHAIFGNSSDGMLLELMTFKENIDNLLVGSVMCSPENMVANHEEEYRISSVFWTQAHSFKMRFF